MHSDVDIAILLDDNIPIGEYPYGYSSEILADLMRGLNTNCADLIILNNASIFLRF